MKKQQGGFRRAWFRGLRPEDVNLALAQLGERNQELENELATAHATAQGLIERLSSAEETLETFHATLEHIGTLLSLAEERAREIEQAAEAEATRVREEADKRVREADDRVQALVAQRRQALTELAALGASIAAVSDEVEAVPSASVLALPVRDPAQIAL